MNSIFIKYSVWILPLLIIVLSLLLKMFVNRTTSAPQFLAGVLELPIDIVFLSMSLTVAYSISKVENVALGTSWLVLCFVIAIVSVVFWRMSLRFFEDNKSIHCIFLATLNYLVSVLISYFSVEMIAGV